MIIDHESEAARLENEANEEAKSLGEGAISRDYTLVAVAVLISLMLFLAIVYFIVVGQAELPMAAFSDKTSARDRFELRGLFGDQWGAFTGIVSGLSFAFVALSLFAQRSELQMSRRELSMQRVELKYARAQSHRQLHELRLQRQEEMRRAIFQKEPIVIVSAVRMVPAVNDIELHFALDHFGPTACNVEFEASFDDAAEFVLNAPQILSEDLGVVHKLRPAEVGHLDKCARAELDILIKLRLKYRNLAGGGFVCDQTFKISAFLVKSAILRTDDAPRSFHAVATTLQQAEVRGFVSSVE